jgi:MYXO-CTERM domain-containing protein
MTMPTLLLLALAEPSVEVVTHRHDLRSAPGAQAVRHELRVDGIPVLGAATTLPPISTLPIRIDRAPSPGATSHWRIGPSALHRVWRVQGAFDPVALTHPVLEVDAHTGHVHVVHDHVMSARASAYPNNPIVTPEPSSYELADLLPDATTLEGTRMRATSCAGPGGGGVQWQGLDPCAFEQLAIADADGDFLYEPNEPSYEDAFAETSLYAHADRFTTAMATHGVDEYRCLSTSGEDTLSLVANYHREGPAPYNNAHFTSWCVSAVLMGQTEEVDSSYDGEVVYHELGHAVVFSTVPTYLGGFRRRPEAYVNDALALNEAIADFLASAYTNDSLHAEYWSGYRDLDNDLACAASFDGEQHQDGQAFAGVLWSLFEREGEIAIDIVLDMLSTAPNDMTFEEASASIVEVTNTALGAAAAAELEADLTDRVLLDCLRVRAFEPDMLLRLAPSDEFTTWAPPPLQISIEVPEDATSMRLEFLVYDLGTRTIAAADVLVRHGEPVEFLYEGEAEPYSVDAVYDFAQADVAPIAPIEIPVEGGATAYVAFANRSPDTWRLLFASNVTFELDTGDTTGGESTSTGSADDTTSTGDADPTTSSSTTSADESGGSSSSAAADDDTASDGCGCASSGGAHALPSLVVLAAARRRRRRA